MKKELLKKMKYEMPGKPKQAGKGPMAEDMEVEISLEEPEMEETGMPEMEGEGEAQMAEGEDMEEMEAPDLSLFSDEELQAELDRRMAPATGPAKMA